MDLDAHRDGVGSGTGFKEGEEGEGEVRDKGLEVVHGGVEVEVVGNERKGQMRVVQRKGQAKMRIG